MAIVDENCWEEIRGYWWREKDTGEEIGVETLIITETKS